MQAFAAVVLHAANGQSAQQQPAAGGSQIHKICFRQDPRKVLLNSKIIPRPHELQTEISFFLHFLVLQIGEGFAVY